MAPAPAVYCPTHPALSPCHRLILLSYLIMLVASYTVALSAAQSINRSEIDRQALLSFKSGITSDHLGVLRSWRKGSLHFCSWRGVTCGTILPPRVVSLDLNSAQLSGHLSPFIANLTSLARINLENNSLSGGIPEELGTLGQLKSLILASNGFVGFIHGSLGTSRSLNVVNLAYNSLSGGIPHFLATSSSLTVLNLTSNSFSGVIPANLFNDSSELIVVDLGMNSFTGHIPYFHKVTALQILNLGYNNLSGSIPASLGNVSSLTRISVQINNLAGSIPETLGHIQNLSVLLLDENNLSGHVPTMLYNISSLRILDLGQNNLVGRMPSSIGYSLPNLERLYMSSNMFEGSIPASLANASKLQVVYLENNTLVGSVPSLGSLSDLYLLDLGNNNLVSEDWTFLTSLTNCTQLRRVNMDGNHLNGSLSRSVGNLSAGLEFLNFGNNQIVGPIPVEIANLLGLVGLILGQNQFIDTVPIKIYNLFNLQMLDIGQNLLTGGISPIIGNLSVLTILDLSGNKLSGQIPPTIGNLSQLNRLSLDNNNLSGNIPSSLGNFQQLFMLNLSANTLHGSIPQEIGVLIHLVLLDVSSNNLSGEIPSSLAQCVALSLIDLSQNNFVGQIPEFFANFSLLGHLDLSNNDFQGQIPTSGIFLNSSAVALHGNTRLCAINFIFGFPFCSTTSTTESKKNARLLVIVILIIAIALFSFLCFMVTLLKRSQAHTTPCRPRYKEIRKKVSYVDILRATNWFSPINKIGSSRTGSVYIGRFEYETDLVAIKLFHLDQHGAHDSFLTECKVLRNTRHRNLVKAVTVCSTVDLENNEFKAIVFEFMANGSLDLWVHPKLHQNSPKRGLSLGQMMRIAMDVASALDYMHNQLTPPLIHCDVKPSNVLLDYDMTARLGDFGSAKFLSSSLGDPEGLATVGGTIGYIAPEYGMGYKISTGCDVYSFGVLLLEMLTGKRPTDAMFTDGLSLHKVVSLAFPDRLEEVLDPNMPHQEHHACATALMESCVVPLVEVGLLCSMESPKDRPGMREVCAKIFAINVSFLESW